MIAELVEWVSGLLLIIGAAFSALAALGVLRFPDVYARLHAAAKAGTVGAGFVLLAIAVASPDLATAVRALLGIGFMVLTGPISAHLLARAAFLAGYRPADITGDNDYKNVR